MIAKQNLCYFTVPSNKVNKQRGRLQIMYDVHFSYSACTHDATIKAYRLATIQASHHTGNWSDDRLLRYGHLKFFREGSSGKGVWSIVGRSVDRSDFIYSSSLRYTPVTPSCDLRRPQRLQIADGCRKSQQRDRHSNAVLRSHWNTDRNRSLCFCILLKMRIFRLC